MPVKMRSLTCCEYSHSAVGRRKGMHSVRAVVFAQVFWTCLVCSFFSFLLFIMLQQLLVDCKMWQFALQWPVPAWECALLHVCSVDGIVLFCEHLSLSLTYDMNDVLLYCLQLVGPATKLGLVWPTITLTSTTAWWRRRVEVRHQNHPAVHTQVWCWWHLHSVV